MTEALRSQAGVLAAWHPLRPRPTADRHVPPGGRISELANSIVMAKVAGPLHVLCTAGVQRMICIVYVLEAVRARRICG